MHEKFKLREMVIERVAAVGHRAAETHVIARLRSDSAYYSKIVADYEQREANAFVRGARSVREARSNGARYHKVCNLVRARKVAAVMSSFHRSDDPEQAVIRHPPRAVRE